LTRLTVRRLPHDTTEFDVRDLFEEIGEVLRVELTSNHLAAGHEQIAHLEVATEAQAADAIRHLNGRQIKGHAIVVERS